MREAAALRAQFAGRIDVRAGIEANIIGLDGALDIPAALKDVDVVAAGYHRSALCQGLLDNALMHAGRLFAKRRAKEAITQAFVQAVRTNRLSYLVHLGQHTGPLGYEDIARACAEHNVAIEISAHKGHLCFTPQDARAMKACGAVFVVNSDAHAPRHIGRFDALSGFIAQAGLTCRDIVNARGYEGRRPRGL
jgi:putative hydrolase